MITPGYARTMAAYNAEMNRRWYAAADTLTDAQRREDRGAFFGSVHGTLCHLVWGDSTWMHRFDDFPMPPGSIAESPRMIGDWQALREARVALDARIAAFAGRLTQAWLDTELSWFSGSQQKTLVMPRGLLVTHMFNHQAHHRGQAHAILTSFGAKTGDTDLPFVL